MINIYIVLGILFIHWVADFLFQTDKMATGKSKNWTDLLNHTATYSLIWWIAGLMYVAYSFKQFPIQPTSNLFPVFYFTAITFICHTITDYFTSRLNSKLWKEQKVHWFFVSVGFDQLLHYTQLLLTYYVLTK